MGTLIHFLVFIYCINSLANGASEITNKVCTLHRYEQCSQLARNGELACQKSFNRIDCLLNINNSISHLGMVKAEEAFLAAPLISDNVVVIGELQRVLWTPYRTVVVVKKNFEGGFEKLRGKKYCHPGFKYNPLITKLVLEEFENKVLKNDDICNANGQTLVEKHVDALSKFFNSTCRPGLWTQDVNLDRQLKGKYPNLCDLCGPNKCDVDFKTPMNDSVNCLVSNDADVALTTVKHAQALERDYPGKYASMCKDGSIMPLTNPCYWTSQIHDLIVANRDKANEMQNLMKKYFLEESYDTNIEKVKSYLTSIMNIEPHSRIKFVDQIETLSSFVAGRRDVPTVTQSKKCDVSMRWCTRNAIEQEKCRWFSQASLSQGIQPVVECILTEYDDELSCLQDIRSNKSDVVTVSTNHAYTAAKYDLVSIAYPETDTRYVYAIEVVLKDDNPAKKISDLKNQRACFPEFAGKEMLAFVHYLQKNGIVHKNIDFGESLKEFVGKSCFPGIQRSDVTQMEEEDRMNFCSQCEPKYNNLTARYCNADKSNKYYGSDGALSCLADNKADYAVVSAIEISNDTAALKKVLCRNNSIAKDVSLKDEECALTVIVASEVVSRANNARIPDYILALREYEVLFAEYLDKPFELFEVFNGTKDLLFKDSTPGIRFTDTDIYIENFKKLVDVFNKGHITTTTTTPSSTSNPVNPNNDAARTSILFPLLLLLPSVYLVNLM